MSAHTEERIALDAAVKAKDGFFTTFFVSPYSKYVARFAARRGWTPNAVTTLAFGLSTLAAAAFALGTRYGLVAGAVLLQVSFTLDCVDGQLARYTRTFSNLGAWLDSVLDRLKEYVVYAGLAVGSVRGFDEDVWTLAAAALVVQTVRHMVDLSYLASDQDTPVERDDKPVAPPARHERRPRISALGRSGVNANRALERRAWTRWGKRILVLPIGERFALISLTAALSTPRTTFVALLAWGGVAAAHAGAARVLQSVAR